MIVDDHKMIAFGIATQLNEVEGITVIEVVTNPGNFYNKVVEKEPNAVLMDIRMGKYNGLELAKMVKKEKPEIKIILMSGYNISHMAKDSGADAFASKEESVASLAQTIKKVCIDQACVFPRLEESTVLTNAEIKVLKLISEDKTRKEIAQVLFISEKTVTNHISSILDKLQVRSRIGAVMKGVELGIIDGR
jgi:DNA-binding NarL/FixJ family response regulator